MITIKNKKKKLISLLNYATFHLNYNFRRIVLVFKLFSFVIYD